MKGMSVFAAARSGLKRFRRARHVVAPAFLSRVLRRRVDALTHNKTFWSKICKKTQNFGDLLASRLTDTLEIGQFRGRNGQIHVVSRESFTAWVAAKTPVLHPPKIQLDLQKAQWINDELARSPNQSAFARKLGIDRTSLIRTLNLTRLVPAIKDYIMGLEPATRECPLTKKHLRCVATTADPEIQKRLFKQLIESLKIKRPDYIKMPSFP